MGIGSSTTISKTTQEQEDLKWLGERFPYGDEELRLLYRAHQRLLSSSLSSSSASSSSQNKGMTGSSASSSSSLLSSSSPSSSPPPPSSSRSFLQDWAVECMRIVQDSYELKVPPIPNRTTMTQQQQQLPTKDEYEERRALIQMMEEYILDGTDIGNTLYLVSCVAPGDVSIYHCYEQQQEQEQQVTTTTTTNTTTNNNNNTTTKTTTTQQPQMVDEFTRKARLEHLFEGLSSMGRRGAKHSLTVLFDAVYHQQQQQQQTQQYKQQQSLEESSCTTTADAATADTTTTTTSTWDPSSSSSSSTGDGGGGSSSSSSSKSIPAGPLIEMGYRLALATGFLQALQAKEKNNHQRKLQQQKQQQQQYPQEGESQHHVHFATTTITTTMDEAPLQQRTQDADDDNDDDNKDEEKDLDLLTWASQQLLPQFIPTSNFVHGLQPLTYSLIQKTKTSKRDRHGNNNIWMTTTTTQSKTQSLDNDNNDDDNDHDDLSTTATIELRNVLEWSEYITPLFASILPTFLFHILFWGRPYPPTRTAFEFPNHRHHHDDCNNNKNKNNKNDTECDDKEESKSSSKEEPHFGLSTTIICFGMYIIITNGIIFSIVHIRNRWSFF